MTEPLADGYNAIVNVGYDSLSWYLDNLGKRQHGIIAESQIAESQPAPLCHRSLPLTGLLDSQAQIGNMCT